MMCIEETKTFKLQVKKYKETRISLCTKVKLKTKILIMKTKNNLKIICTNFFAMIF